MLELLNDKISFLIVLPSKLSPASTIVSSIFLAPIFFDSFYTEFTIDKTPSGDFINEFALSEKGKIPPDRIILDNWIFENFILADDPFVKVLLIFKTCVLVKDNLCGELVSLLEFSIKFDERVKVTSVPFFITDLNLLIYEINNFTFNVLYRVILY